MLDRVKVTVKKPEATKQNSVHRKPEVQSPESINSPVDYILHLQRTIGNRAVNRLLQSGVLQAKLRIGQPNNIYDQEADRIAEPVIRISDPKVQRQSTDQSEFKTSATSGNSQIQPVSDTLEKIVDRLSRAAINPGSQILFAGSLVKKKPPGGLTFISNKYGRKLLPGRVVGGWAGIKGPGAFTCPAFITKTITKKKGEFFAKVQPTTAKDATHEAYYPGQGYHKRLISGSNKQVIGGKTYYHYVAISRKMSDLIRNGEQEHLNDVLRAYNITYKLIADRINSIAGRRFGPAKTPYNAEVIAINELKRKLPKQLGTHPAKWVKMLDTLLKATHIRDDKKWHAVENGPSKIRRNMIIWPLQKTNTTRIGTVPSNRIVNYPP